MVIHTRLVLGLVTLLVCSLIVAGCTSMNAEDDKKYTDAVQSAGAELNPMIDDLVIAMDANDYSTVQTLGVTLSTRAEFWYDKIASMPVSSQCLNHKKVLCVALYEMKGHNGGWTTEALNKDKVTNYGSLTSSSSTLKSANDNQKVVEQRTVPVQTTLQSANYDKKFTDAVRSAIEEINPILIDITNAANANQDSQVKTLGMKLSTRAQFWYDKIAPMPVSAKYQDAKTAYLQVLYEAAAGGDGMTKGVQLVQAGKRFEGGNALILAGQHLDNAESYLQIMQKKMSW